jgi:hypothetical protein
VDGAGTSGGAAREIAREGGKTERGRDNIVIYREREREGE